MSIRTFTAIGNATSPQFQLKPLQEKNFMNDYDEFNPTRCAEVAAGAFVALLAIGVVKVIVQSLLNN
jgi:hypothetical protein